MIYFHSHIILFTSFSPYFALLPLHPHLLTLQSLCLISSSHHFLYLATSTPSLALSKKLSKIKSVNHMLLLKEMAFLTCVDLKTEKYGVISFYPTANPKVHFHKKKFQTSNSISFSCVNIACSAWNDAIKFLSLKFSITFAPLWATGSSVWWTQYK